VVLKAGVAYQQRSESRKAEIEARKAEARRKEEEKKTPPPKSKSKK
jgi:hypothetical protein